ncbi:MAG TPA: hypothetical protein VGR35_06145 [Tepidisphaeraceae bacterium]|nr:hypothetical protein [Tepidisphaeraceae bacterium]
MRYLIGCVLLLATCAPSASAQASKITVNEDGVLLVDGKKVFPIGFTMPPQPGATTLDGKDGIAELYDAGGSFMRTGPSGKQGWDDAWIAHEKKWQDAAARAGMRCLPWLKELAHIEQGATEKEKRLRHVIDTFKDHPGMGVWKGDDEPEWGKTPVPQLERAFQIIREQDSNHPVWIVEAPRGTVDTLRNYSNPKTRDITGVDIYPISYPPGLHSLLPNDEISLVGDHTRIMMDVAQGKMPVWLTLQIAWSGVWKEGRTLRFPTYHQQRFMAYQAIINGARGLIWFGGNLEVTLNERDKKHGWNWTYWNSTLRPLIEEIGHKGPLTPVLVAPDSDLQLLPKVVGMTFGRAKGLELLVREVGEDIYILACKREGDAVQIVFDGLPPTEPVAEVMFESPRKVMVENGKLTDWFDAFDVHVYKLKRTGPNPSTKGVRE